MERLKLKLQAVKLQGKVWEEQDPSKKLELMLELEQVISQMRKCKN